MTGSSVETVVLKVWFPGQQLLHPLRNLLARRILRYQSDTLSKNLQRWGPAACILTMLQMIRMHAQFEGLCKQHYLH